MARNTTLRDLMGLGDQATPLRETALVMIDLQNTYRQGIMQLEGVEPAVAEAARLLARARAAGIPVFHVMHDAGEGSPYDVRAEIGQISDEVAPIAGEPVIVKNFPSAFSLGYHPTVVASATATRDLPGPDGVPVQASALQAASLAAISDLFGVVVGKADDIPD
jgi:nicotinamidase-related amidase